MRITVFLVIMLIPTLLGAADLKLVVKIPYERLRGEIPSLVPGYDYGERGVELWADLDSDCFETQDDVLNLFFDWLAIWYPGHGLPKVLEIRCRCAGPDTSLAVIAETDVHGTPPDHLRVFIASAHGARVIQQLFDTQPGGSALVLDPYLDFIIEDGCAVGVLYCDHSFRDEDSEGCSVFSVFEKARQHQFIVTQLVRVVRDGSQRFLAITSAAPGEWMIRRIGARVETIATLNATPDEIPADVIGSKAAREVKAVQSFLAKFDSLVREERAKIVFNGGYLRHYAGILEKRSLLQSGPSQAGSGENR